MGNDADGRTESATPKRRNKEREKGNISKSQDLSSAIMITIGIGILSIFSKHILFLIETMLRNTFTHLNPDNINTDNILLILMPFITVCAKILLPFLILLVIVGIFVVRMQIGHVFSPGKIKLDFGNLSPSKVLQNAKNMLNPVAPRNLVEFVKSLAKLLVVFFCGYSAISARKAELYGLLGLSLQSSFAIVGSILTQMMINICLAMLVIGFLDKKYQDYEYEKSIKMTKQEVKDEFKDSEGDPKIKSKIRSVQMKMAKNRMMAKIPKADVVVTNPTHYAVALEYNKLKNPAPRVVAKGVDFVAFTIKEVARNNNVPIVENPPLARALYKLVPIDGIIPSDMFVAVAEVLAYVYNKNKRGGS
ncbi:MAG: flagellar biosynthesis protein FlhB [Candidatus Gastranaerophilales bacterium]|nr:flagellar biosynthesis protein FlhB [Candidatus Gastranaerophilales bacterium]